MHEPARPTVGTMHWRQPGDGPVTTVEDVRLRLKNMIHRGELGPGDRLPPERELCGMLQVSRSTLREGLQALRSDGYVETRRGAGGGTFVSRLDEPYARWLRSMSEDTGLLRDIMDLRMAVECQIAWLAAQRREQEQLDAMAATLVPPPSGLTARAFRDADARFHAGLADAAHSRRLKALMSRARGALFVPASAPLIHEDTIARTQSQHAQIFDAVREGDGLAASEAMRSHLLATYLDVTGAVAELPSGR